MKLAIIYGTRPELIRLSVILKKIHEFIPDYFTIHTGQNYDFELDKIFFKELKLTKPDYYLDSKGSFGNQIGNSFKKLEKILLKEKPDKLLVLGDTNCIMSSNL